MLVKENERKKQPLQKMSNKNPSSVRAIQEISVKKLCYVYLQTENGK